MPPRRRTQTDAEDGTRTGSSVDDMLPRTSRSSRDMQGEEEDERRNDGSSSRVTLTGDRGNIALLTMLYVLQGIPLGLCSAIPMILQNRHISYRQQAVFSLVNWPFSLKLLWAPLVDSVYIPSMGRRKSWLVPTQYLIGLFMYILSATADDLFGIGTNNPPKVYAITAVFFALCFLAATQDIAVDGWALTMLSRRNVGYASTCNCIGQTAGYFIGFVVFLALESADFCNRYLRSTPQDQGLTTLSGFLYFWSFIYLITTSLVWALKTERRGSVETETATGTDDCHGIKDTYRLLLRIIRLPAVQMLILFLLTMKMGFAAPDAVTMLKLSDYGVPKDKLALLAIPLMPLQIILPVIISKYTAGPRPLDVLIRAYPYRLLFGVIYPMLVWMTPSMRSSSGEYPYYFYGIVMVLYALHQVALYSMFVAIMGFFAKISDPSIGGTYMTLLNTLSNLGGNWPVTVALYFVDPLTLKRCVSDTSPDVGPCDTDAELETCTSVDGRCVTSIDGYYVECLVSIGIGFLWLFWGRRQVRRMQSVGEAAWRTNR